MSSIRKEKHNPQNKQTKKMLVKKGRVGAMLENISENLYQKYCYSFDEKKYTKLIKSTHQTNGTYIYRINKKLKHINI